MTKRTTLMFAVLVLVAILAHAYLYWWAGSDDHGYFDRLPYVKEVSDTLADSYPLARTPITTPSEEPKGETGAERKYSDTEYTFSFQYPEEWTVSKAKVADKITYCLGVANATGGCSVSIRSEMEGVNMSTDVAWNALMAEARNQTVMEADRTVGGKEARVMSINGSGEAKFTRAAVFLHDDRVYIVQAMGGGEAEFERILATLSFY